MNREQASNILDAYIRMHDSYETGKRQAPDVDKALSSLRDVILDAMTSFKPATGGIVTTPYIGKNVTIPTMYPTNWDGTPKVTCTGIDPMFGHTTSASTVYANGHTQEAVE